MYCSERKKLTKYEQNQRITYTTVKIRPLYAALYQRDQLFGKAMN